MRNYWKPKSLGSSPWGAIQSQVKICRGVRIVSTAGHGGALVGKGWAQKNLSIAAQKQGDPWGNYLVYEEDSAIQVLFLEFPEAHEKGGYCSPYNRQQYIESLSRYSPEYLIAVGIEPSKKEYEYYLKQARRDLRRKLQDPDLIVAASSIENDPNLVKVWTADNQDHVVVKESYRKSQELEYNLSDCEISGYSIPN